MGTIPKGAASEAFIAATESIYREYMPQCKCFEQKEFGEAVLAKYDAIFEYVAQSLVMDAIGDGLCPDVIKLLAARLMGRVATDVEAVVGDWANVLTQYVEVMAEGGGRISVSGVGTINLPATKIMLAEIYNIATRQLDAGAKQMQAMTDDDKKAAGLATEGSVLTRPN